MKTPIVVLFSVVMAVAALAAPTREEALQAITTLEQNVLGDGAAEAASVITRFAQESEEVRFTLGPAAIPWITEGYDRNEKSDALRSMLMAAYFAGNAKAQLDTGKPKDDPYHGWLAAIRAYRQIQQKTTLIIPSLEQLDRLERDGALQRHAETVQNEAASSQPAEAARAEPAASSGKTSDAPPPATASAAVRSATAPARPAAGEGYTDETLGLHFPARLGEFSYEKFRRFEPAAMGYGVTYAPEAGGAGTISCFVYNRGLALIPDGGGADVVRQEMAETIALIRPGWKERGGVVEDIVPSAEIHADTDPRPLALLAVHRITLGKVANLSITVLAGYRNTFLKVRYTAPGSDPNSALAKLKACWDDLAQANPPLADALLRKPAAAAAASASAPSTSPTRPADQQL